MYANKILHIQFIAPNYSLVAINLYISCPYDILSINFHLFSVIMQLTFYLLSYKIFINKERKIDMAKYDLCVFDMDGTILNTLDDITNSVNVLMERYNFKTFTVPEIRSLVGHGLRDLMEHCIPDGEKEPQFETIYREFLAYYSEHSNDETHLYDGIYDLVKKLKNDGIKLAILSNKRNSRVIELSKEYFGDIIDLPVGEKQDEGVPLKPAPDAVFNILKELNVPLEKAVYIGDGDTDFHTAKNAGMDFIAVSWGFRDRSVHLELGSKVIVDTADDLYSAITGK